MSVSKKKIIINRNKKTWKDKQFHCWLLPPGGQNENTSPVTIFFVTQISVHFCQRGSSDIFSVLSNLIYSLCFTEKWSHETVKSVRNMNSCYQRFVCLQTIFSKRRQKNVFAQTDSSNTTDGEVTRLSRLETNNSCGLKQHSHITAIKA